MRRTRGSGSGPRRSRARCAHCAGERQPGSEATKGATWAMPEPPGDEVGGGEVGERDVDRLRRRRRARRRRPPPRAPSTVASDGHGVAFSSSIHGLGRPTLLGGGGARRRPSPGGRRPRRRRTRARPRRGRRPGPPPASASSGSGTWLKENAATTAAHDPDASGQPPRVGHDRRRALALVDARASRRPRRARSAVRPPRAMARLAAPVPAPTSATRRPASGMGDAATSTSASRS